MQSCHEPALKNFKADQLAMQKRSEMSGSQVSMVGRKFGDGIESIQVLHYLNASTFQKYRFGKACTSNRQIN